MEPFELLRFVLFLHVFVAVVTFGVAAVLLVCLVQMRRATNMTVLGTWESVASRCGPLFPILVLLLIGFGAWLIHLSGGRWEWSDGWIISAVSGLVVMEGVGGALLAPADKKLTKLVEEHPSGDVPPAVHAAVRNPVTWGGYFLNLSTALGILFLMSSRPDGGWSAGIVIGAGVLGIVVGVALSGSRTARP